MTDEEFETRYYAVEMDFILAAKKLNDCYAAIDNLRWWQWIKMVCLANKLEQLKINYQQAKLKVFQLYDELDE